MLPAERPEVEMMAVVEDTEFNAFADNLANLAVSLPVRALERSVGAAWTEGKKSSGEVQEETQPKFTNLMSNNDLK
ncbi:hypothetical protein KSP39_PZI022511 [Platanthera zijinensis]|uniref:Uncharacterized protein n=1 Tax=Platanthera zijinensis TaxID=2320716 RepID=A0AAP0FV79_9ASPA